jgi:hypothetical protein
MAVAAANNPVVGIAPPLTALIPSGAALDFFDFGGRFRTGFRLILKIKNIIRNNIKNIEAYNRYLFGSVKGCSSVKTKIPVKDKPIIPARRIKETARLRTAFLDIVIGKTLLNYTLLFGLIKDRRRNVTAGPG